MGRCPDGRRLPGERFLLPPQQLLSGSTAAHQDPRNLLASATLGHFFSLSHQPSETGHHLGCVWKTIRDLQDSREQLQNILDLFLQRERAVCEVSLGLGRKRTWFGLANGLA